MKNSKLEKFQNQELSEANATNLKGGGIDYGAVINNAINYTVFGGYGQDSWLWRLTNCG